MKRGRIIFLVCAFGLAGCAGAEPGDAQRAAPPMMGWNSWISYAGTINESQCLENIDVMVRKLKSSGYEYFVIDGGWYLFPGREAALDEWGRQVPAKEKFPEGFSRVAAYAHRHGLKFGIHMMRGIPRLAVERNTPVKGTDYAAGDIADVTDTCRWSSQMYGVDMSRPGAQEYYDSVLEQLASWGVDFIKYDDIAMKPLEIEAVAKAIRNTGRDIRLSLSPGDVINEAFIESYNKADMLRITRDIWDEQRDIDICFERWERMQDYDQIGFHLDLDMIPFGHINLPFPISGGKPNSTRGFERLDKFTPAQKNTFMTQRAMAASPLFMGGALPTTPEEDFRRITNPDMLECNQNGVCGKLLRRIRKFPGFIDVWKTKDRTEADEGWIGIFNRGNEHVHFKCRLKSLGLDKDKEYALYDIWRRMEVECGRVLEFDIEAGDVVFLHYSKRL